MKTARFNKAQYLGFYRARSPRLRAAPCSSVTMVSVLRRSARRSVVGLAVGVDTASDSRVVDGLLVSAVLLPFARLGRYAAVGQGGQTSDGRLCPGSYQVMPPAALGHAGQLNRPTNRSKDYRSKDSRIGSGLWRVRPTGDGVLILSGIRDGRQSADHDGRRYDTAGVMLSGCLRWGRRAALVLRRNRVFQDWRGRPARVR